jgi:hypothetical protein
MSEKYIPSDVHQFIRRVQPYASEGAVMKAMEFGGIPNRGVGSKSLRNALDRERVAIQLASQGDIFLDPIAAKKKRKMDAGNRYAQQMKSGRRRR